jgi:hypothetical protein
VLHLACHCNTEIEEVSMHSIDLGKRLGTITYSDLTTQAGMPEAWAAPRPRPLVFLNACGSAAPASAASVACGTCAGLGFARKRYPF